MFAWSIIKYLTGQLNGHVTNYIMKYTSHTYHNHIVKVRQTHKILGYFHYTMKSINAWRAKHMLVLTKKLYRETKIRIKIVKVGKNKSKFTDYYQTTQSSKVKNQVCVYSVLQETPKSVFFLIWQQNYGINLIIPETERPNKIRNISYEVALEHSAPKLPRVILELLQPHYHKTING